MKSGHGETLGERLGSRIELAIGRISLLRTSKCRGGEEDVVILPEEAYLKVPG